MFLATFPIVGKWVEGDFRMQEFTSVYDVTVPIKYNCVFSNSAFMSIPLLLMTDGISDWINAHNNVVTTLVFVVFNMSNLIMSTS